jgi:hypothetical protein
MGQLCTGSTSWKKCFYSHAIPSQDVRNLALQVQAKAPHTNLGIFQDNLRFSPGSSIHWSHFNFGSQGHSPSSYRGSLGASSSRGSSAEGSPLQVAAAMGPRNHVSNLHLPQTLTKPSWMTQPMDPPRSIPSPKHHALLLGACRFSPPPQTLPEYTPAQAPRTPLATPARHLNHVRRSCMS